MVINERWRNAINQRGFGRHYIFSLLLSYKGMHKVFERYVVLCSTVLDLVNESFDLFKLIRNQRNVDKNFNTYFKKCIVSFQKKIQTIH